MLLNIPHFQLIFKLDGMKNSGFGKKKCRMPEKGIRQ
jgi:hypothetical protein